MKVKYKSAFAISLADNTIDSHFCVVPGDFTPLLFRQSGQSEYSIKWKGTYVEGRRLTFCVMLENLYNSKLKSLQIVFTLIKKHTLMSQY